MKKTLRNTSLSLVAAAVMTVAQATSPVFAAPAVVDTISVGDNPVSVAFSPDGKTAYVANSGSDTLSVIDVKTGTLRGSPISVGDNPVSVAFSKDGKTAHFLFYDDYVPPPT